MDPILKALQQQAGIYFAEDARLQAPTFAMDAQSALVTVSNTGLPSLLTTNIDPKIIKVLVTPMKAAEIVGEEIKKGDWTTDTAMFLMVESTGEVSSYGDYSNNGVAGANAQYPQRQSYLYQVITQWGERELQRAGIGFLDWANQLSIASVLTLNKFQNKSYFFGVVNLELYGLLNDPNLFAPIAPTSEAGNVTWALKDGLGVYADIQALYTQLQTQTNNSGYVELDTKMTLAMSPSSEVALTKVTTFNVNVSDMIKKNFPNITVKTAPEYATASGQLVQLIADEIEGQRTVSVAFNEKLRAHAMVVGHSNFSQKKSQGTFGAIVFRPMFIAQMLGV